MADFVLPSAVAVKDPIKASDHNTVRTALSNLDLRLSGISTIVLPGGSFEDDLNGWTVTVQGIGATYVIDDTASADGLKSLKSTVNATGSFVEALNDTRLPVYPGARVELPFWYKSTVATCRVRANIRWLNAAGSLISELSAYDSSANLSSSWAPVSGRSTQLVAPATAAWMEIKMIAGDGTIAGVVHFDSIRPFIYRGLVSVDMNDSNALISSSLSSGITLTIPSLVIGNETPWAVLLHVANLSYTGGSTGTSFMSFQEESGGDYGGYYVVAVDPGGTGPGFVQRLPHVICPVRQRDKTVRISEGDLTGSSTMATRDIYLAGYYV